MSRTGTACISIITGLWPFVQVLVGMEGTVILKRRFAGRPAHIAVNIIVAGLLTAGLVLSLAKTVEIFCHVLTSDLNELFAIMKSCS